MSEKLKDESNKKILSSSERKIKINYFDGMRALLDKHPINNKNENEK